MPLDYAIGFLKPTGGCSKPDVFLCFSNGNILVVEFLVESMGTGKKYSMNYKLNQKNFRNNHKYGLNYCYCMLYRNERILWK